MKLTVRAALEPTESLRRVKRNLRSQEVRPGYLPDHFIQ